MGMCTKSCPGARFTNGFLPAIQIRWKFRLAVIPLLAIRPQQFFAHVTTAQLSCHVQNFAAITVLKSRWEWTKFPSKLNCGGKIVSETGPSVQSIPLPQAILWRCQVSDSYARLPQLSTLQWRHNERDGVSNHRRPDFLLDRLFRRRSRKIPKLCLTGLCEGNPPVIGGFPPQTANNAENGSIWWRHHGMCSSQFYWRYWNINNCQFA